MADIPTAEGLLLLLGGFPEREPLDVCVLGGRDVEGCRCTRLEYTAYAGTRVPAFLLTPRERPAEGRLPGVLAIHQDGNRTHRRFGKSELLGLSGDGDQRYGVELCQRGYAVLCPDRPGFEDRQGQMSPGGRSRELFELHRAVDCLLAQPEVDGRRIGVIGHSAGGWLAAQLMFTDPRVRAGAVSCGALLARWSSIPKEHLPPGYNIPKTLPGFLEWGDHDDVLAGIAPRPYFETRGDSLGPAYDDELTRKARARYAELGVPERFVYAATHELKHAFPADRRQQAYAWLDRWIKEVH